MAISPYSATKPIKTKGLFDAAGAGGKTYEQWAASAPAGTPMPTIAPSQIDDSVVNRVNEIIANDSPLMQQARTDALKFGNRRGLLNSSITAGAAQNEVLRAATPLASQDSAQAAAKNAAARAFEYGMASQDSAQGLQRELTFAQIASTEGLAKAQRDLDVFMQRAQLDAADQQQIRDIASREGMAAADRALQEMTQLRDIGWRSTQAEQDRLFQSTQAGLDRDSAERSQLRDIGWRSTQAEQDRIFQSSQSGLTRDAAERAQLREIGYQTSERALERGLQERIASWNLSSSDRNAAATFLTNMEQLYNTSVQSIMANTNLSADQRTAQLTSARNLRDRQLNFVEQMYDIDLEWGQPASGGASGAATTSAATTSTAGAPVSRTAAPVLPTRANGGTTFGGIALDGR